jgi:hypothetical protein
VCSFTFSITFLIVVDFPWSKYTLNSYFALRYALKCKGKLIECINTIQINKLYL